MIITTRTKRIQLLDSLTPELTLNHIAAQSKKRVLEIASEAIADALINTMGQTPETPGAENILEALLARERLGSTALGRGIAIPHCRIKELPGPVACLTTLQKPIDFDGFGAQEVDIVLTLVVQENTEGAEDRHLSMLARIVELFNQPSLLEEIRHSQDDQALYRIIAHYETAYNDDN